MGYGSLYSCGFSDEGRVEAASLSGVGRDVCCPIAARPSAASVSGTATGFRRRHASCRIGLSVPGGASACRTVVMVSALAEKTEMWMVCLPLEG